MSRIGGKRGHAPVPAGGTPWPTTHDAEARELTGAMSPLGEVFAAIASAVPERAELEIRVTSCGLRGCRVPGHQGRLVSWELRTEDAYPGGRERTTWRGTVLADGTVNVEGVYVDRFAEGSAFAW